MIYSHRFALESLAAALAEGLRQELHLTPKPGLVDRLDNGSHPDLSHALMAESVELTGSYYRWTTDALAAGASLPQLVALGRKAEERMFTVLKTNTHKGAIFLGGLLLAARARIRSDSPVLLQDSVSRTAHELFEGGGPERTNGSAARNTHGVSGILGEALSGLPSLFEIALPALQEGLAEFGDRRLASYLAMARLMGRLEDTTTLHRCGSQGLERLRSDGRRLEELLLSGQDVAPLLETLNVEYRRMNLTMGGVADLLGMAFGYAAYLEMTAGRVQPENLPTPAEAFASA